MNSSRRQSYSVTPRDHNIMDDITAKNALSFDIAGHSFKAIEEKVNWGIRVKDLEQYIPDAAINSSNL